MHKTKSVLITGAGIAGPTAAFWLSRAGFRVTVVERASGIRATGQSVDIRGHGLTVIQRMGLETNVRAKSTQEQGIRFVDKKNTCKAAFPVNDGFSFTSDIEIMRGELAQIFYEATNEEVEYIFGEQVGAISETQDAVTIEFANGASPRSVDIVIAADGWASTTRAIAFGDWQKNAVHSLGEWAVWFTIPWEKTDTAWARWYNAPRGRIFFLRPDSAECTRAALRIKTSDERLDKVSRKSVDEQKHLITHLVEDAGWEGPRIIKGMYQATDFYMQKIAQIKLKHWSKGRTVVVGDAGYCPSPMSGMGTTVAIVGAYVLAGEIAANPGNHPAAFEAYERKMQSLVKKAQKLARGAPAMINPQTEWGIYILHLILGFFAWTGLYKLLGSPPASAMKLPEYEIRDDVQTTRRV
ncbi:putative monooxygenase fad-binding protein [Phaeomoniella chlamydospora]|uniref:Putative monooxygenase fad-binding protein n=1 Tax=Phaeomoniella chlamydospora TaxID=158046 RepID=A0A0G2GEC2_PHACM|nr:putative monooxygenase fad-binding protein [Phaeomoniella chlamydospora]